MASRSKSKVTTDHDEIRRWVEKRGGRPAVVKATGGKGDDLGILRIDFPGFSGEGTLEPISWEEFFEKFDREGLAFVYQETTASGQKSNFNKIVKRETVMERAGAKRSRARKTGARGKSERGERVPPLAQRKQQGVNALPAQASRARAARVPGHRRPWRENRAAANRRVEKRENAGDRAGNLWLGRNGL
jgi:hypothetical protein